MNAITLLSVSILAGLFAIIPVLDRVVAVAVTPGAPWP
jgi:hypothetical protein